MTSQGVRIHQPSTTGATGPVATRRGRRWGRGSDTPAHLRDNRTAYLMIVPMVVLLGIFVIWPLVYSFYLSTFEISFYQEPTFVGLQFYRYVLESPRFWNSLWVGFKSVVFIVPATLILSFLIASLIKSLGARLAGAMKTAIYIPTAISAVVASVVFTLMYQARGGLINGLLKPLGVGPFAFLSDVDLALPAITVPAVWLALGISTLIMLAGMMDIPQAYYEAAALDGAGFLQRTRYVTLPLLRNVILFVLVTGCIAAIQLLDLPLVMTKGSGGPVDSTMTPNLYILSQFRDPRPFATSFSITAALLLFIILGTLTAVIFRVVRSDKAVDG
ncbi:MAG: sugar ABC transporter permease [Chloroflexota bacterium]